MIAAALLLVFLTAKGLALWGRHVEWNLWTALSLVWQDLLVAALFFSVAQLLRRRTPTLVLYALAACYVAINLPVQRVLSTPLTLPLLRAARGTIADSITPYITAGNLLLVGVVLAVAVVAPLLMRGQETAVSARRGALLACGGLALLVIGPWSDRRADTGGFGRNPIVALAQSTVSRVGTAADSGDMRSSPFATGHGSDLDSLHGVARGRNVLFIVLESTAAQYLRPFGAADDPMPNLSRLAAGAIRFDEAYTVYPESVKGMVSYLASRYPAFDVPAEAHVGAMAPSLASILGTHGYTTALFHSGRFMYLGMDALLANAGFDTLADAGDIGGNHNSSFGVDEPSTVSALLHWIDARKGRPFFGVYMPAAGHHPYLHEHPGPWPDNSDRNRYRNALHEGDEALGQLFDGLRSRGLDDSTLIVVFGDHGEAFGQHEGNFAHTLYIYEENVRVPLLFVIPDEGRRGSSEKRVASLVDVPPTVLDLLGLEAPPQFEGHSLLRPEPRMAFFFTDYSLGLLGLRDECYKYIWQMESSRSRLYDLCQDPGEQHDIAPALPQRTSTYRDLLQRWSAAQLAKMTATR